jgi:hypothetical protein
MGGMDQDIISMRLKLGWRWRSILVEQHHLMKIEDELVMGIWSSGLISLRLKSSSPRALLWR